MSSTEKYESWKFFVEKILYIHISVDDLKKVEWVRMSSMIQFYFWCFVTHLPKSFSLDIPQFSSVTQSCPTLCNPTASLSFTISQNLLKIMSIESVMPSNHLILCRPLLLLSSIFPSIRAFSNESALRFRWPNDWSFSFNISPSNEYSRLTSFRTY